MKLLLATHNEHKRRELARLLGAATRWSCCPPMWSCRRRMGETFAENALGKARAAALATGRVSIADDSGIEAAALGGAPGVRSARYAGERCDRRGEPGEAAARGAGGQWACVRVRARVRRSARAGVERVFEARCTGRLAAEPRGAGGFGYDPAFLPDDGDWGPPAPTDKSPSTLTMAELSDEQKDAISHRGRAARALLAWLKAG